MTFRVTFADGLAYDFSYDANVEKGLGSLYQKHQYFDNPPEESEDLPTDYLEVVLPSPAQVPTLGFPAWGLLTLLAGVVGTTLLWSRAD